MAIDSHNFDIVGLVGCRSRTLTVLLAVEFVGCPSTWMFVGSRNIDQTIDALSHRFCIRIPANLKVSFSFELRRHIIFRRFPCNFSFFICVADINYLIKVMKFDLI